MGRLTAPTYDVRSKGVPHVHHWADVDCTPLATAAVPGSTQTIRLRGTIESADKSGLAFRFADGTQARLALAQDATIIAVVKASISGIKQGTFLGSAALPQPDGSQRALEVHIFPEEMRGAGEGHRAYAPVPQGTMTNGTSSEPAVTGVEGSTSVEMLIASGRASTSFTPSASCGSSVQGSLQTRHQPRHRSQNQARLQRELATCQSRLERVVIEAFEFHHLSIPIGRLAGTR